MDFLADDVERWGRRNGLFEGVERLLVGCSGGGDSTALLELLHEIAPRFGMSLAVAHLHHGWRGAEADRDLDTAREQAAAHGLPFFERRVDLRAARGSREEAARNARLEFFRDVAAGWPADAVAVGHNADDQLETVVLNLARGTGRRGLGGIKPRSQVDGLLIVRPLLEARRGDLRTYARSRGLRWHDDSSNRDISLSRNRLRHRLLHELQQIHPAAVDNVVRSTALLREEEAWLAELAAETLAGLVVDDEYPGGVGLDVASLAGLARPLRRRVVRVALERVRGHGRGLSLEHVDWVVDAVAAGAAATRDLPGVRAGIEGNRLRLLPLAGRRLMEPGSG